MEPWIAITIGAAAAQTLRFMAQKQLTVAGLSAGGATLARFLYSAPLVAAFVLAYGMARGFAFPALTGAF